MDKSTVTVIYAIAASQQLPLLHLYVTSAFMTEKYRHDRPVHVNQMPRFSSTLTHQDSPIGLFRLNLYGTEPTCHIYHTGLYNHLRCHGFQALEADPCLYIRHSAGGTTLAANTIDYLLVLAPLQHALNEFKSILQSKYRVKHLGAPSRYLGWTITR